MFNRIGIITRAAASQIVARMGVLRPMGFRRGQRRAFGVLRTAVITSMLVCSMGVEGVVAASGPLCSGAQYGGGSDPELAPISDPEGGGNGMFADHVTYDVGDSPWPVATADLDGDGDADLAVANAEDDNVSILLNQGDGTFAADVTYPVGDAPYGVAIDDLDADGDPDVATANYGSDNVSILLNHGDGTFVAGGTYGTGDGPFSVAIADLDGDGDADLAVVNTDDDNVSVLLNHGDGTFAGDTTYDLLGWYSSGIAIYDLDGDGDADLAVATNGRVSILLNHGDGTFAAQVPYGGSQDAISVAIADLDGDGDADLALASFYEGTVSILLNQGDGTFADEVTYYVSYETVCVATADLDGDGDTDVAVVNYWDDSVSVLENHGDGTFAADFSYSVGRDPGFIAISDLDSDGDMDLAVANWRDNNVSILLNQSAVDCNDSGIPDECDVDCGPPGGACDLPGCGQSLDCNGNGIPDECEAQDVPCGRLDVKPGSCPNPFNRNSHGVLPVAFLETENFDVADVDVDSVRLRRADGVGGEVAPNEGPPGPHSVFQDVATPFEGEPCECHDLTTDGIDDLSMKFRTDDLVEALDLNDLNNGDEVELVITGTLVDDTEFTSAGDCILIVPPGIANLAVTSNAADLFVDVVPADLDVDGGGFPAFERAFNPGTTITLTAPASADGRSFRAWKINGVLQTTGQTAIEVTIIEGLTTRAVYRPQAIKEPGLGDHDGWPIPLQR